VSGTALGEGAPLLIDCTLGGSGHSALLLEPHPDWQLIGLDQDPTARAAAAVQMAPHGDRVRIEAANFGAWTPPADLRAVAVLADLGVSSPQLDRAERGFSFRADGPIDMRMNPEAGESAAELLDRLEVGALADVQFQFGEERLSRRIVRRLHAPQIALMARLMDNANAPVGDPCIVPSSPMSRPPPCL
jgi:16S rRNA (cytosine1402-N4)-methyltransferase